MKGKDMLKKIILGIIIGAVVLTIGAGSIYAYQKNYVPADEFATTKSYSFVSGNKISDSTVNKNKQYCFQQGKSEQLNFPNDDCPKQVCANKNCTEQYCNRINNCYRYNNDEDGYQNRNNFCYRNISGNQDFNGNCLQNGKNNTSVNKVKNNFGKNK